ncbi:hypothetical protein C1645_830297 [Glomus cerebriforme]|uniref:Uncharacterized protein n=1 Tax=Glomus cerebriforme TaxID=658196 RepID=A0A397SSE4_9GLOM|nr:hypothetical protein C1645_830297 [Glomus cerebriforme]
MIYKIENNYGTGNWLENKYEFSEFLDYCDKLKKIKNAADFDNLPSGPLFNMMNSVKASKNAHVASTIYFLIHSLQPFYTYPLSQLQSISIYLLLLSQLIPYLPLLSQLILTYLPSLSQLISTYLPPILQLTSIPHLNNDSNPIEKVIF